MPLIDHPSSPLVGKLRGVHLFGYDPAPCSQRVGFALAEKGLTRQRAVRFHDDKPASLSAAPGSYIYRHVSLPRHDNLSAAYAAIQPNMVVPALVHDGRLFIESMDIIGYLDEAWPEQPLVPRDPVAAALCAELVAAGKDLHISIRHITFHWSLGKLGRIDAATQARINTMQREGSPEQLAEFYARFSGDQINDEEFVGHLRKLEDGYAIQEQRLASDGRRFLTGDTFCIADIVWSIKVLRLSECGYPLAQNFPLLAAWSERVRQRPAFRDGVLGRYRFFHHAFRVKAAVENFLGKGIRSASRAAAA